jgi:predicted extracellular nuclease
VLIVGDLNSYAEGGPDRRPEGGRYRHLIDAEGDERPTPTSSTASGATSTTRSPAVAAPQVTGAGDVHINADEPSVLDYNVNFKTPGQVPRCTRRTGSATATTTRC